jgi:fumarate reductase flavoprotein subunit
MNTKKVVLVLAILAAVALAVTAQDKAPAYGKFSGTVDASVPGFGATMEESAPDVKVTLTLKNGLITKAVITGAKETKEIGGKVIAAAPKIIVARNSPEIDIVTGATITSQAIIDAGNKALEKVK